MKKRILSICLITALTVVITGCGNNSSKSKGKCEAKECISKINTSDTVEQINSTIGFDGELVEEKYNKYNWQLSEDTSVEVTYYSSKNGTIKITVPNDSIKNNKVDFSKYSELQSKVREGITYDEFKTYVGNVDGVMVEKSNVINKYTWVSSNGDYLTAAFSAKTNECTFASGQIK